MTNFGGPPPQKIEAQTQSSLKLLFLIKTSKVTKFTKTKTSEKHTCVCVVEAASSEVAHTALEDDLAHKPDTSHEAH